MLPLHCQNKLFNLVHLNIQALKLAPLLAQYLHANKRLDLPGIGSFLLDTVSYPEPENSKPGSESIHFESNPSTKESPDLVTFISAQTGKMKALAAADLSSHLDLVHEFLNIGKPFLLEGIGSLARIKSGVYSFSGPNLPAEKTKEHSAKEIAATSATEESFSSTEVKKGIKLDWRKPAMIAMAIIGTGLAIWGGYTISKRSKVSNIPTTNNSEVLAATTLVTDTSILIKDSTTLALPKPAGGYKFVLETASRIRAFDRYNRLKNYHWNVQMETRDSVKYKLYMLLPTADTNWVLDSLTALNGRRVYIENN